VAFAKLTERWQARLPGVLLALAAGAAATVPVIVSIVRGVSAGVAPNGDRAIILMRAYDVFSSHAPLVGQYSATTVLSGHTTYSLGPLLYWLLSLPARHGGPAAPAITVGVVNVLAVIGAIALAHRRGGRALMLLGAVAIALCCRSLVAETYHDIWNPAAGVLPLLALMFVCWSIACGDVWLLPLAALLASFEAQAELTYVLPSLGLLLVAAGGLGCGAIARLRARREEPLRWRAPLPWWLAALAVGALCWEAPVREELSGHPGNITRAINAALINKPTLGLGDAWHAIVRTVGIPPWWLRVPSGPFDRLAAVRADPGAFAEVTAVLVLAALLAVAVIGAVRRRRDIAAAGAIGLVLCAAVGAVAGSTPTRPSIVTTLSYTLWWASPAGMWAWLALAWSTATLLPRARLRRISMPRAATAAAAAAAIGVALGVGGGVAAAQRADQDQPEYRAIRFLMARVPAALPPEVRRVRVAGSSGFTPFDFRSAVAYALRRRGFQIAVPQAAQRLGAYYAGAGLRPQGTVGVWEGAPPPGSGRVLSRVAAALPSSVTITVTFARRPARQPRRGAPPARARHRRARH
jgi:hypothetical protein